MVGAPGADDRNPPGPSRWQTVWPSAPSCARVEPSMTVRPWCFAEANALREQNTQVAALAEQVVVLSRRLR